MKRKNAILTDFLTEKEYYNNINKLARKVCIVQILKKK